MQTIEQLRTTVPKLDWRMLIEAAPETPVNIIEALDKYFDAFAQPSTLKKTDGKTDFGEIPCLKCNEPLAGGLATFLLGGKGGFTWGLAHGEGHCRNCHWPARAHHFIKDSEGVDFATLRNVILQYHPDVVVKAKKRKTQER